MAKIDVAHSMKRAVPDIEVVMQDVKRAVTENILYAADGYLMRVQ